MSRKTFSEKREMFIGSEYYPGNEPDVIKYKFIEICHFILTSTDKKLLSYAYTEFFRYITYGEPFLNVSITFDVMRKILNDVDSSDMKLSPDNFYSPFQRLISFIKNTHFLYPYISLFDDIQDEKKTLYISNILNVKIE